MQLSLSLTLSCATFGELVPVLRTGANCTGDADDCLLEPFGWSDTDEMTTVATVVDIISLLERSSSSLSKGVMVVAANWTDADGRFPYMFLRTLQARHEQPVYTADVKHLLENGHRKISGDYRPDEITVVAEDGSPVMPPCRRPAIADHWHSFMLPPRSRYVVLFHGSSARSATVKDPFAELAKLNYTFWNADVYYLIVVPEFDLIIRQIIYGAWKSLFIYKYGC